MGKPEFVRRRLTYMPHISVIIPTCDRPEFLQDAVNSVLSQTYQDFELLIVNDGSRPIQHFADPRIRILDGKQRGAVPARNLGVQSAQGDVIAFLDDDDVWTARDHLAFAAKSGADFFFADGLMRFPNGDSKIFAHDADAKSLELNNTILISAVCYKRSMHAALGAFDEYLPYYWDWDWYLRIARAGATLQRRALPVVDIRVHENNMSGQSNMLARHANLNLFCAKHALENVVLKGHIDFV